MQPWCTCGLRDILPRMVFISDKVQIGRRIKGADGVKDSSLPHTVYFGQQKTNSADDHWQNADMPKNTDQRGNKDDLGTILSGRRTPNLDRSYCQRRSLSLRWQTSSFKHLEKPLRSQGQHPSSGRTSQ
ncbi:hypothetical protein KCP74_13205 [Salmonella enterica subsp. enterica]|nr:hypothetical protein KCP74_13205 [Salmonella enterica subsp. enterica]